MIKVTKFRIATYGIYIRDGRVLMTETKVPSGVILNFPGGGLELGEGPVDGLKREFVEETGMSVAIEELLYATRLFQQNPDYPHEQLLHVYYRAVPDAGNTPIKGAAEDIVGIQWIAPSQMKDLYIMPSDREFIESDAFEKLW